MLSDSEDDGLVCDCRSWDFHPRWLSRLRQIRRWRRK